MLGQREMLTIVQAEKISAESMDASEQLLPIRRDLQLLRMTIFLDSHFV